METFSPMRLAQIWRYPVKSMIGEQVSSIEVARHGFVGDRHWAVRDEVRGGIRGAKKIGEPQSTPPACHEHKRQETRRASEYAASVS